MSLPRDLTWKYLTDTALPYIVNISPTDTSAYFAAGSNILTSIKKYLERRPGFATYETTPTTFAAGSNIRRIFTWETWAGVFYVFINVIDATTSNVYKLQVGTDNSFSLIYTDTTTGVFDFTASRNIAWFSNANVALQYNGTGTKANPWGINTSPMGTPTTTTYGTTGITATAGYKYVFVYQNSTTGHYSSPSKASLSTGVISTAKTIQVVQHASNDDQVDKVNIYRTTDGGGGIYFEITGSPITNPGAGGTATNIKHVSGATNANPIVITTSQTHGWSTGDTIVTTNVSGNPAANSTTTITVLTTTTFSLDGIAGNGAYTGNGECSRRLAVTNATNATPIVITTATHGYTTGMEVTIASVGGNTAANGTWIITNVSATTFSLNNSVGNGAYTSGGTAVSTSNWGIPDTTLDKNLSSTFAPIAAQNDPPTPGQGCEWFANRIWLFTNNTLYFSGWEEIGDIGVEEACFPPTNYMKFSNAIHGLAALNEALLVFTADTIWAITGDSLDKFERAKLFAHLGCRNPWNVTKIGRAVAWLDTNNTIRITDGYTQVEVGTPIRQDVASIDHAKSSLTFYSNGAIHWLCLFGGTEGKMWVYDLDTEQWMPPWTVTAFASHWGEVAPGDYRLFVGHNSRKFLRMTPTAYQDNAANYTASITLGMVNQLPTVPLKGVEVGSLGTLEYVSVETDATQPTTVKHLLDEDPTTGTFVDVTANKVDPVPYRTQGTNVKEAWYYAAGFSSATVARTATRRASVQLNWAAANANFKCYTIALASDAKELQ